MKARRAAILGVGLGLGLAACGGSSGNPACGTATGTACDGTRLYVCNDTQTGSHDCHDDGVACGYVDGTTGFSCVADACAGVGALGTCSGDELVRCADGDTTVTTCGSDQPCQFVDEATGYACAAANGTIGIHGTIRYEDRPQVGDGSLGPIRQLPARGVTVVVVGASGQTLATVVAADSGTFVARLPDPGEMVHITAVAQSTLPSRPVSVTSSGGQVHGASSPTFVPGGDDQVDLLITEASGEAEAFNVFDQMLKTMDGIRGALGNPTPTPLRAIWARGSSDGTYYGGHTLHLLGRSDDDDGYDDTVILHETGHFVEDTEGRSSSSGGAHDGQPADPRLAWSEGWSTYWAQSILGQPVYSDSNAEGGFFENLDTDLTHASATGGLTQNVSEYLVAEILWDLGDGGVLDDDRVSSNSPDDVRRIQPGYLKTAQLRNVGASGVDLVDFLDGWFVTQGLGACAAVRDIVTNTRKFPYDYAGPGGTCPP